MPNALSLVQKSDCTTPLLQLLVYRDGRLLDPVSLEFQIWAENSVAKQLAPVQLYPSTPGNKTTVNLADCPTGEKLGLGRFVVKYDPSTDGTSPTKGRHFIRWYVTKETGDSEEIFEERFDFTSSTIPPADSYAQVADMRDEGVTSATASNERVLLALKLARRYVDRTCGRTFEATYKDVKMSGRGGPFLLLQEPVIAVEDITIETPLVTTTPVIDSSYDVYNRHIEQNLLQPDDRNNPKIELVFHQLSNSVTSSTWPLGGQNIHVLGVFGYTEPDGLSAVGNTPEEIKQVTMRLAMRELYKLIDFDKREDFTRRFQILQEKTDVQSVTYGLPRGRGQSAILGYFTGDPNIDTILAAYMRPPMIGAA
jgi:hypothetical protein